MAPLMIAGPEPAPTKKQPFATRDRFDITDLMLLYKAVTREPRLVIKVLKDRCFRTSYENQARVGAPKDGAPF